MLKKDIIIVNAHPYALSKKIVGKVWNIPCAESDVQMMRDKFRIANIARDEDTGEVLLRVLPDEQPTDRSQILAPVLEDYSVCI